MSSSILIPFVVFLLIAEKQTVCCLAIKNNVTFDCFRRERKALLRFKASFSDFNNMLSSWRANSDCCAWRGVECDDASNIGHVVGLHLGCSMLRSDAVDSSLLELKYLSYLDLSGNDFQLSLIPSFLGSMKQLQYLNLSYANFVGTVPHQLGNLSSLRTLVLGGYGYFDGKSQIVDDLTWAINLSLLEYLDMSNVSLNATKNLVKVLGMLPSLVELRLSNCRLGRSTNLVLITNCANFTLFTNNDQHHDLIHNSLGENSASCFLNNMTSLRFLDLSRNYLPGVTLSFLENLRALRVLDLSENLFSGSIPSTLGNLEALRVLSLAGNHLSGEIPISLGQLLNLESIDMHSNSFKGTLSEAHFAKLSKLEYINVGSNYELKLRVRYDWVPPFHRLKTLRMSSVEIIGDQFPQWLQTQKSLTELVLSNCSITGTLPKWLSSFVNLGELDLSNNQIEGPIPELPSGLEALDLSRNFINGPIPDSLCQMKALEELDLSKNHLSSNIPHCSGNLESLLYARLSSNQLSGPIPSSIGGAYNLEFLQLNNNSLTDRTPSSLRNCTRLKFLDIGDNKLTGKLPEWIGKEVMYLVALRLRNNTFYGDIPSSYCKLPWLGIMDLAHNHLTGNIPNCFGNFISMIKNVRVDVDFESGLSLSEMMKGVMLEYTRTLKYLVNLDLSDNHLSGKIPLELTNLTSLNGLNLSHNHIGGTIPQKIGDMVSLESFDLSNNNIHGTIPQSLSKLTSLSLLNLSNNDLSGQIPIGPQLQTFNASIYGGNSGLCGDPLPMKCHNTSNELPESLRKVENDDVDDKIYLYSSIVTGIATGFGGYFGVLIFKKSWRVALFRYMDALIGKILGR